MDERNGCDACAERPGACPRSGVYLIFQTRTRKVYVGSAVNVRARKRQHVLALERGTHPNAHLQHAYNRDPDAFEFVIALHCPAAALLDAEQGFLSEVYGDRCFNINPTAGSMAGYEHTPVARAKISAAHGRRGHNGVSAWRGRWRARVTVDGRQRHLGMFDSRRQAEAAVRASRHSVDTCLRHGK